MGFIAPYATRLTVIIGILLVAVREICVYILEMLGLYTEDSCNSSTTIIGGADLDMDSFQYPYLTMNFNENTFQASMRASLVPLVYEGPDECGKEVNARCGGTRGALQEGTSMDCSVCLCEFEKGQQVHMTPNCCHVFHSECIHKWLDQAQKTCPLCRTSLVAQISGVPSVAFTS